MNNPHYSLKEIATWTQDNIVSLPTVQRGFVWKPYQIENLWDSILRGYPIGAFVLSPRKIKGNGESKFDMLDGQQRATAICLGFGNNTFRNSQDNIKVFIDLEKPKADDNRKYIFRVITQSHPWGYQRTDNTKTLTSDNIRKAMDLFNIDDHLKATLDNFFPYDAILPIPYNYFTDAAINNESISVLREKISNWIHFAKIISRSDNDRKNEVIICNNLVNIQNRVDEILQVTKNILNSKNSQKIPALYLDFERFKKSLDYDKDKITENDLEEIKNDELDNSKDEIENLFIRLNAGGTPLTGEDLNYSVLKANISSEIQDLIEKSCLGLFKPARFITIAYRLFQNQYKNDNRESITLRIKPKQFQKTMNEPGDFEQFLKDLLEKRSYKNKTLLVYTKNILEYDKVYNSYGLPYLITSKIADKAPEVMFILLYRLMIKKDKFDFNSDLHRKMLGIITLFMWLGKGKNQRDHGKLLTNVWPCVKKSTQELFWSSSSVQRAMLNETLTPFPNFDKKYDRNRLINILNYDVTHNSDIKSRFHNDTGFGRFIEVMFNKEDLILYAQREFLHSQFKEIQYCLDDTNLPFDWDHISPNNLVFGKKHIPSIISNWYNSIGNYRAWPYSLNRIDQDNVPAIKLNPLDKQNYEDESVYITIGGF